MTKRASNVQSSKADDRRISLPALKLNHYASKIKKG